ncbi:MAG: metallophosphoesterase [candidate division KSB1 bacterium]|nr:metallophosphoesterase [candidate division KSB1 bacterium]MDZ7275628.1 metallophosphoesterase [candidate division KSB1 bacterium]MDZ7284681.1 metallophosphoesterase [candidate division KSB1 bacterium]MDZ7297900.1 metallophosphoesterase [candidate division KSB1 bacterium]MDZ7305972.1 metallophosphoesterase [candidate division KSB1 bacterium]
MSGLIKKNQRRCLWLLLVLGWQAPGQAQDSLCGYVPAIGTREKAFTFGIWGDPQVAHYAPGTRLGSEENKANAKTVVPRLQQTVALTNRLAPAFVITLGDNIHNTGEWENFNVFVQAVQPLQMPLYLLMGNHDHVPAADTLAGNPLGRREFANFRWAQQQINGLDKVNYSFDAGDWHFILFSQPGGHGYGVDAYLERHPEYLAWLEADLAANRDRPTMFFTHHPLLPVGRVQFDHYGPGAAHRARLVELLTRHGNVQYAFFGHVHNTVAAIPLISWRYRGTAFIVMPNAANFARQADYLETAQSSWGLGLVRLNGAQCESITFHTLAGESIALDPATFEEYDDRRYGYLQPEWALPAAESIRNGSFEEDGPAGWFVNHLLPYENPPVQKRLVVTGGAFEGSRFLQLYTKARASVYDTQSYLTVEVRQAVSAPAAGQWPVLKLHYKIAAAEYRFPEVCQPFIMVAGFKAGERVHRFALAYSLGEPFSFFGVRGPYVCLKLAPVFDEWRELTLYPRSDFARYFPEKSWENLAIDRVVVTLGVHNANYSPTAENAEAGAGFDKVSWTTTSSPTPPTTGIMGNLRTHATGFRLYQNYPNPFNPETRISFDLAQPATVRLEVCDLNGRVVAVLQQGRLPAGFHTFAWRPVAQTPSGVYLLRCNVNAMVQTRKMILLR